MVIRKIVEKPSYKDSEYKYPLPKGFENDKAPYRETSKTYSKDHYRDREYSREQNSKESRDHPKDYNK